MKTLSPRDGFSRLCRTAVNDLRRHRREDVRLARARHRGNAKTSACVAEDVLLGGARSEGSKCHAGMGQIYMKYYSWLLYNAHSSDCTLFGRWLFAGF